MENSTHIRRYRWVGGAVALPLTKLRGPFSTPDHCRRLGEQDHSA